MAIMRRRKPRGLSGKVKEAFWPSMGWLRTFHYYRHRLFRTGDSDYRITAGLAMGAAISFTPFLGTHILQAMLLTWLIRGSLIAGAVGTFIGNPWTYPLMFITAYKIGIALCVFFGLGSFESLPQDIPVANADHDPWRFFMYMMEHPLKVLLPLTLGGYMCSALSWPVFYGILWYPVRVMQKTYVYKNRRSKRNEKK